MLARIKPICEENAGDEKQFGLVDELFVSLDPVQGSRWLRPGSRSIR